MKPLKSLSSLVAEGEMQSIAFWFLAVMIAAALIYVHLVASLTLPVPSGDEAFFVWQARAFQLSNSFIAPELDPGRPILLLPFVYQTSVGIVFKVFGCSLEIARHVSLAFVLASFAFLAVLVRRSAAPLVALLVVGAILLNPRFVVMANAIRMEPLFFAVICGALLLMQREQNWMALAVLSISPMIHPYGVLYLAAAMIYVLLGRGLRHEQPGRAVIVILILSGLIWAAHGIYVLRYWDGFIHDTALRFGEVTTGTGKEAINRFGWREAFGLGLIAATAAVGVWRRASVGYLLIFAFGAWLHSHVRFEEPYWPFGDLVYMLLSLALIEIAAGVSASTESLCGPRFRRVAACVVAIGLFALLRINGNIDGPVNYLRDLRHVGMGVGPAGAYIRDEDRRALQNLLKSFEPNRPISVEVYPWGDALLLADLKDERIRFQVPYFDPLFRPAEQWTWGYGPTEGAVPDLYIVRVSRFTAPHLRYRPDAMVARAMRHSGDAKPSVVHSRDGTEIWYAIRPPKESK